MRNHGFRFRAAERNEMLSSTSRYYPRARVLVSARSRNYDVAPCPRVENEGGPQTRGGRPPASVPTRHVEGDGHEASPPRISASRCGCRRASGRRGARERAQSYPTRPVRLILGFPAGGSTDLVARIMGAWLTERLGQSVVVENKPGGGTNLAAQTAINSPPDGYTLLFVTTTNAI